MYRLVMDDATTAIAYLWDDGENYWPAAEGDDDLTDPFSPGLGLGLFEAAHARLDALGVHVPAIRLVDRDGAHCPADLAIVEDLPGESLEESLARDRRAAAPVMARLAEALAIDIEGLMYFDVEWEHVFLRIRLHDAYRPLGVDGLDQDRLALYMLAQRLSLTAGPLRLLDGDYPDRAFMTGMAEYNLKQALELIHASIPGRPQPVR